MPSFEATTRCSPRSSSPISPGWSSRRDRLDPNDPAFIVYTSGTTGHPKGALVAHGKHLAATANLVEHYPTLAQKPHRTVAYLPLCHVLGRDVAVTLPLISRLVPHFGESPEDLPTTLFESAPTVLFTVPRYLQKFASQVLVGILNSSSSKRATAELALRFARGHARRRWNGEAGFAREALYRACRAGVFLPILNKLGFDQLELVICGGAPLPPETMALWQMLGVNVVEMYGQTETAGGIITGQRGPFPRPGDVGTVATGWEVKLCRRRRSAGAAVADLFEGYWNNPDATRAIKGEDGWLRTGDIGEWRDERAPARRPRARLHRHLRRQDDLAVVHREYPARQPLRRRGGRVRPRPQIPDRARRDRLRYGRRLGAQPRRGLYRLHQPRPATRM